MNTYLFKTNATMKEYNCEKYWIDSSVVRDKYIKAKDVNEAIEKYKELVEEKEYITISSNAIKNKSPMYIDTKDGQAKQVGYVITGKTDFQRNDGSWVEQYIDLWINITMVVDVEF